MSPPWCLPWHLPPCGLPTLPCPPLQSSEYLPQQLLRTHELTLWARPRTHIPEVRRPVPFQRTVPEENLSPSPTPLT